MSQRCPKCDGRGEVLKKPNFHGGVYEAYIADAHATKQCSRCGGLGRIGLDLLKDILVEIKLDSSGKIQKLAEKALEELSATSTGDTEGGDGDG